MSRKAKAGRKVPRGGAAVAGVTNLPAGARGRWTAAGAARAARDARIATAAHLRGAAVAQQWEASQLIASYQVLHDHVCAESRAPRFLLRGRLLDESVLALLFGGAGLTAPFPVTFDEGARAVLDRRADNLDAATLYVLSPPMCDVVVAAAQTLSLDDIALLDHDDLPSPTGMLMLPHPILVRAVNGSLGDNRAYVWTSPAEVSRPAAVRSKRPAQPGGRYTTYDDAYGPVRPDSFRDMAALAAAQRTPLPPLVPDATQTFPFRLEVTEQRRAAADHLAEHARATADGLRELPENAGRREGDDVVASFDYRPGDEIDDRDDLFTLRFLYAFWRLCGQDIVQLDDAPVGHSAQVLAERAGVPAQVRVASLRTVRRAGSAEPTGGRDWQHQWVVRMHKVRQWYPSQNRHKIIYRGPYLKGPADKPLLGGEVVRSLHRT